MNRWKLISQVLQNVFLLFYFVLTSNFAACFSPSYLFADHHLKLCLLIFCTSPLSHPLWVNMFTIFIVSHIQIFCMKMCIHLFVLYNHYTLWCWLFCTDWMFWMHACWLSFANASDKILAVKYLGVPGKQRASDIWGPIILISRYH